MSRVAPLALVALVVAVPFTPAADEIPPAKQYQAFVLKQAAELRKNDKAPATADEWAKQEDALRKQLFAAWGGEACFLPKPCDLDPKQHGETLKRDGYTVEKITFQTRPGVRMTANLYVPDAAKKKPAPAILQVHGHWRGAKQDPVVQSRCIGAAKLGFVVLCVDAFGAGERGIGTALGEYHGEMTAATLLPLGGPKGSGLSLLFECLTGVLAGTPLLTARAGLTDRRPAQQNALVIAFNVANFRPLADYRRDVGLLGQLVKGLPRQKGVEDLLLPGERGGRELRLRRSKDIPLAVKLWRELGEIAQSLDVPPAALT